MRLQIAPPWKLYDKPASVHSKTVRVMTSCWCISAENPGLKGETFGDKIQKNGGARLRTRERRRLRDNAHAE